MAEEEDDNEKVRGSLHSQSHHPTPYSEEATLAVEAAEEGNQHQTRRSYGYNMACYAA